MTPTSIERYRDQKCRGIPHAGRYLVGVTDQGVLVTVGEVPADDDIDADEWCLKLLTGRRFVWVIVGNECGPVFLRRLSHRMMPSGQVLLADSSGLSPAPVDSSEGEGRTVFSAPSFIQALIASLNPDEASNRGVSNLTCALDCAIVFSDGRVMLGLVSDSSLEYRSMSGLNINLSLISSPELYGSPPLTFWRGLSSSPTATFSGDPTPATVKPVRRKRLIEDPHKPNTTNTTNT